MDGPVSRCVVPRGDEDGISLRDRDGYKIDRGFLYVRLSVSSISKIPGVLRELDLHHRPL